MRNLIDEILHPGCGKLFAGIGATKNVVFGDDETAIFVGGVKRDFVFAGFSHLSGLRDGRDRIIRPLVKPVRRIGPSSIMRTVQISESAWRFSIRTGAAASGHDGFAWDRPVFPHRIRSFHHTSRI